MISERRLRQIKRSALIELNQIHSAIKNSKKDGESLNVEVLEKIRLNRTIVELSGELLDIHLLQGRSKS